MDELTKALMVKQVKDVLRSKKIAVIFMGYYDTDSLKLYELFEKPYLTNVMYMRSADSIDDTDPFALTTEQRNKLLDLGISFFYLDSASIISNFKSHLTDPNNKKKTLVLDLENMDSHDVIYTKYKKYFRNVIFIVRGPSVEICTKYLVTLKESEKINPFTDIGIILQIDLEDNPEEIKVLDLAKVFEGQIYTNAVKIASLSCTTCHTHGQVGYHVPTIDRAVLDVWDRIQELVVRCPSCEEEITLYDYELDDKLLNNLNETYRNIDK